MALYPDKKLIFETCGSYRRGKPSQGDVDILVTTESLVDEYNQIKGMLPKIVEQLEKEGFIKERLGSLRFSHTGSQTFLGICQLPGKINRRLDIKVYPRSQFAFAILYFTGSAHFNRSMRLFAQKKGYSLSDFGLSPTLRGTNDTGSKNQKLVLGYGIPCDTEEDIFKALHLPYKSPAERDV